MDNESHEDYQRRQSMIQDLPPIVRGLLRFPVLIIWCFVPYKIWDEWKYFSHLCHYFDYR